MRCLKSLRRGSVLLACVIAYVITAWLLGIAEGRIDSTTVQFEKTFAVLLVVLPSIGLFGIVAETRSREKVGKFLLGSSAGAMSVLFLVGGPFRWFYAPSALLLWIGLVMEWKEQGDENGSLNNGA